MNIAIVDDDKNSRKYLAELLSSFNLLNINNILQFDNGNNFIEVFRENKFGLIFLDIEMPEIDGLSLAKEIHKINSNTLIIFVTNHSSYISEAIRAYAFQYLVKPVKRIDLEIELDRVHKEIQRRNKKIKIDIGDREIIIDISDIEYIESQNKKVIITMQNKQLIAGKGKLRDYVSLLCYNNFASCHKSFLINLEFLKEINNDCIVMEDGKVIPISRSQRNLFKKNYNMYLNGISYDL